MKRTVSGLLREGEKGDALRSRGPSAGRHVGAGSWEREVKGCWQLERVKVAASDQSASGADGSAWHRCVRVCPAQQLHRLNGCTRNWSRAQKRMMRTSGRSSCSECEDARHSTHSQPAAACMDTRRGGQPGLRSKDSARRPCHLCPGKQLRAGGSTASSRRKLCGEAQTAQRGSPRCGGTGPRSGRWSGSTCGRAAQWAESNRLRGNRQSMKRGRGRRWLPV